MCIRDSGAGTHGAGTRVPDATASSGATESTQNRDNDGRGARELTVVVMASTVARTLCWLPLQVFVLADVFAPETDAAPPGPEAADAPGRRKWELFCVCAALTGSCLTLPVLRVASSECRDALRLVLGRRCGETDSPEDRRHLAAVRRAQMVPDSPALTASMLRRQRSHQPDNEFDADPPKHLSLPSSGRLSVTDVNETILSIISDSSNHINYI